MKILCLLATAVLATGSIVESARILAFVPFPAKSHQRVIQPLLKELAVRGHQVVCYSPHPLENPPANYRAVKIPDFMPEMKKAMTQSQDGKEGYKQMSSAVSPFMMILFKGMGLKFVEWVAGIKEVQDLFSSDEKFDAIILETTFFQESFITLGHKFDAPVIEFIPAGNMLWSYWLHGNPYDTSYFMEAVLPYTDRMTLTQKTINTVLSASMRLFWYNYYMPKYQQSMDKYLTYKGHEDRPSMVDMLTNTSLVLVNTHLSVNFPYPYAPHVKEIGGLNIVPSKPLPKDLQTFMDDAKDGVVYFTLGSHIEVSGIFDAHLKEVFTKVFSELKQKVLWKWEKEFEGLPPNVRISKWFPQQDILAHKNLKVFITHGGLLSTTEAVNQGVPTVGIPVMADQYKNVEHMKHYRYGLPLHMDNITYSSLKWAVHEILDNPMYAENAKKRAALFRDKPETALQTAVYWTEYVIRHKGAHHLKPAISRMPWYQQAMLDVYATLFLLLLTPIYITWKAFKWLCCRRSKTKTIDQSKKKN